MGKMYCRKCGKKQDYPVCNECVAKTAQPCPMCGEPVPTITVYDEPRARDTCLSCTAKITAHTRRIGVTCKVCGKRYECKEDKDHYYQVCPDCQQIEIACPICGEPMPKYIKRGNLRKYCSPRCNKLAHPTTSEQAKKANETRWEDHAYSTHQNDIARGRIEYAEWREAVFERDDYTCQDCGAHNHKERGETVELHPHHIKPFAEYPKLRYDVSNGVTLCAGCHRKRHSHTFIGRTKHNGEAPSI